MTRMYQFTIGRFEVRADIRPSDDLDLSWDDDGEVLANLESGLWEAFDTKVSVRFNGVEIASDWLCQSIYADPSEFFSGHRDTDPLNRNCSIMRAHRGDNVTIGHYFPDMVRNAVNEARAWLANARIAA